MDVCTTNTTRSKYQLAISAPELKEAQRRFSRSTLLQYSYFMWLYILVFPLQPVAEKEINSKAGPVRKKESSAPRGGSQEASTIHGEPIRPSRYLPRSPEDALSVT
jgi:hypothetical protein